MSIFTFENPKLLERSSKKWKNGFWTCKMLAPLHEISSAMCIMAAIPHIMGATTHVVFAGGQGGHEVPISAQREPHNPIN